MVRSTQISSGPINWELVKQARMISPSDRLLDGPRLFDLATMVTRAGIREQHPAADEQVILQLLRARIALVERMERRQ